MSKKYVSLHNHTMFSMMNSIIKPNDLFKQASDYNMSAIAVTDYNSLGGIHDAYKASIANKVKLIVGCQLNFVDSRLLYSQWNANNKLDKPKDIPRGLILIAKNQIGYKNLLLINRLGFDCKLGRVPLVDWDIVKEHSDGLICLTGDANGILGRSISERNIDRFNSDLSILKSIFNKDLYIELCANTIRYDNCDQFVVNRYLYNLSKTDKDLQLVPTSNARYLKREQFVIHDIMMAVKNGRVLSDRSRPRYDKDQMYLHTYEDILKFFSRNFDENFAKEICKNTVDAASKCEVAEWIKTDVITGDKTLLPTFPCKDNEDYNEFTSWVKEKNDDKINSLDEDKQFMRFQCEKNFSLIPDQKYNQYIDRYNLELDVYEQLGFCSYMLITQDFLNWARKKDIPIGYGRGSVGGSLVGYLLDIHKADPIKYGLIFERFLNIEKRAFPDIDNDVESVDREKVLQYVIDKFGKDYVAHVSNYMVYTPKVAITDVITCLEIGGSRADAFKIAKNITESIPGDVKSINDVITSSKLFEEFCKEHENVKEYSEQLIGVLRALSTHAAGIVISKHPLPGLVPLRIDDNGVVALEWEKERTEENGLVKIDFLGLETLSIIKTTKKIVKDNYGYDVKEPNFDEYLSDVYDNVTNGNTMCVFQLGASGGTIGLCNATVPESIEDLAAINALARPGVPHDIKKSYIERKFGREEVVIPHPNLDRAVRATFGYCIFEESFLFLAHDFCGWDLQKADKMRKISKLKAKGKHILEELKGDFVESAVRHSKVTPEFAENIWTEWVIPLAGYAFNKSHSVLYSMTSYVTAYLKTYYPSAFLTANLISETNSNSPQAKDNILKIWHALKKLGVKINQPDINKSYSNYRLVNGDELFTGLSALHGVKEPAALNILQNRPFSSFEDLLKRTDSSQVRSTVIQALAASGALDSFGVSRKTMFLYCADLRKKLKKTEDKKICYTLPRDEWTIGELRALELEYLGKAFTGSKQDSFPKLFTDHKAISYISNFESMEEDTNIVMEGEVIDMFFFRVKKEGSKIYGKECCKMLVEDLAGDQCWVIMFPDRLANFRNVFNDIMPNKKMDKGFGVRLSGKLSKYNNETSIIVEDIYGLYEPISAPIDTSAKAISVTTENVKKKKTKEITSNDIEADLLGIIDD